LLNKWTLETDLVGYWEMGLPPHPFKITRKHRKAYRKLNQALQQLGVVVHKVEVETHWPKPRLTDPVPVSADGQAVLDGSLSVAVPPFGGEHFLLLNASFPPRHVSAVGNLPHVTDVVQQGERTRADYVRWTVQPRTGFLGFADDVLHG